MIRPLSVPAALTAGLILATACAAAPSPVRQEGGAGATVSVPSRPLRGMPAVEVMVNGQGPFLFGIDTGAPGPIRLDQATAERLGLPVVGHETTGDGSGENEVEVPIYGLAAFTLGGRPLPAREAHAVDARRWGGEFVGLFGMDVLKDGILTLDFADDTVSLQPGALPSADGRTVFDYAVAEDGLMLLTLTIGGRELQAVLDTGHTAATLVMPEAMARTLITGEPRARGQMRTVSNLLTVYEGDLASPVRLGETTLPISTVTWPGPGEMLLIGSKALRGARVRIDQTHHRIEITWPRGVPSPA
jgi:predicted aspartyl protease